MSINMRITCRHCLGPWAEHGYSYPLHLKTLLKDSFIIVPLYICMFGALHLINSLSIISCGTGSRALSDDSGLFF